MPKRTQQFTIRGPVEIFEVESPWYYVLVPKKYTELFAEMADRGLVAIRARVGESEWDTSLMPMGDGTQFIPLPKKVRKTAMIDLGDRVTVYFALRKR